MPPAGCGSSDGRPGVRPATPVVAPVVILAAVLAAVGLAVDLALLEGVSAWLPDVVVGWAFLVCAVLLHGAGAGRMALLLVLCAVSWFAGGLDPALAFVHRGPLVHLLLAHPTGRLTGPARIVVPGAYLVGVLPGAWGDEVVTCVLAALLVLTAEVQRRSVGGPLRRARGQALVVAVGAAVVLVGSAAARLLLPEGDADRWTLWVYEAGLVGAAALTTRSVLHRTWRVRPVTDLVVLVGQDRSRTVRDALAAEIGDPTLEIGYRSGDGFVDVAGRTVELPASGHRTSVHARRAGGQVRWRCWCTTRSCSPTRRSSRPWRRPPGWRSTTPTCAVPSRRSWSTSRPRGAGWSRSATPNAPGSPGSWTRTRGATSTSCGSGSRGRTRRQGTRSPPRSGGRDSSWTAPCRTSLCSLQVWTRWACRPAGSRPRSGTSPTAARSRSR